MDSESFCHNMEEIAKWAIERNVKFPIMYIVDGNRSHTCLQSIEKARELQIILVVLAPNATNVIQMADKVMFKPIKTAWNDLMFERRRQTQNENFPIESFAPMLKRANDRAVNAELVQTGFRVTGWYPFDKNAVDYSLCLSENTNQPIDFSEGEPGVQPEEDYIQRVIRHMEE